MRSGAFNRHKVNLSYLCRVKFQSTRFASLCLGVFLGSGSVAAQTLTISTSSLDFGDVFTDAPATLNLTVTNTGSDPVIVLDVNVYHSAFFLDDTTWTIPAFGSVSIPVQFSPRHNTPHDTKLVLVSGNYQGNLAVDLTGRGKYPDSYYNSTQDLSQEALKTALTNLIDGHTSLGYTPARDEMYMVIDNQLVNGAGATENTLETCYIGRIVAGYIDRTDAQNSFNVNTEHTWPQSEFGSSEPMQSDLFHLFIADATVNSIRGNLPFGNVITPDWTNSGASRGGGMFEPRDAHKGRTCRGVLYFYLRYGNLGGFLTATQETALRGWHTAFPPEEIEQRRNEDIFEVQNNRNPLIDHPEFDERISSYLGTATEPERNTVVITSGEIDFGIGSGSGARNFDLVLVADGNRDIEVKDLLVSDPALTISSAASAIPAGQSGIITLSFDPPGEMILQDTLYFSTTSSNIPTAAIAISGGAVFIGLNNDLSPQGWNAWFNGSGDLQVSWTQPTFGTVQLFNLSGQLLASADVEREQRIMVRLPEVPSGHYLVEWAGPQGIFRTPVFRP